MTEEKERKIWKIMARLQSSARRSESIKMNRQAGQYESFSSETQACWEALLEAEDRLFRSLIEDRISIEKTGNLR